MKNDILIELARRWEEEADKNFCRSHANNEIDFNSEDEGIRKTLRGCADTLRMLVDILGKT